MNEEAAERPWWRKRRWWVMGILLLVLVVGALPGYRFLKGWRAEMLAEQALELAADESGYYAAWERASSAYYLAPGNAKVVRALAEVYSKSDPGQAMEYWARALELSGGNREDRIGLALSALELGILETVEAQLDALREMGVVTEELARLEAATLARKQQFEEALDRLQSWVDREDSEEASHSLYLQVSLASADAELRRRGLNHIEVLAGRDGEVGIKALRLLLPVGEKDTDLIRLLDERLEAHPLVERGDRLRWISWKLRAGHLDPERAYAEARELFILESEEELVELGRWLNQNGYSDRVVELVGESMARRRQDLFLVYMDALAILGRWQEVRGILETGSVPLETYLQQVFLARSYYETGMDRRARLGWQRVRLEIANEPEKLAFFASYARKLGLHEEAREAYKRMTRLPVSQRAGYLERVRMERQLGEMEYLREALKAMHEAYPEEVSVENDLLYVTFLSGAVEPENIDRARDLVRRNPNYLAHRITLALGLLQADEPQQAIAAFEGLDIPLMEISSSFRTVLGAVLRRNGQHPQADASFRGIDTRNLMEGELKLFEAYARRADDSSS